MYKRPPRVHPNRRWWQELLMRLGASLIVFGIVLVLLPSLPWPLSVLALVGGYLALRWIGVGRFARSRNAEQSAMGTSDESSGRSADER